MRPLAEYTTAALLRELDSRDEDLSVRFLLKALASRKDGGPHLKPITRWCENCVHWRFSKNDKDTANNCRKGHAMEFKVPEDYDFDDSGFYRRGCTDWCATPPRAPAPHNPSPPDPPRPPPGSTPRSVK